MRTRRILFRNLGEEKFEEVTAKVGSALQRPMVGRGAAYGDFDNDGDLDLVDHRQQWASAAAAQRQRKSERHAAGKDRWHAIESRWHRRKSHAHDEHGRTPVPHGEDWFKLFVAKRTAAHLRPGKTGSRQDSEPRDCLAQRAERHAF